MRTEAIKTTRGAAGNAPTHHGDPGAVIQLAPARPGWAALLGDEPSGPRRVPVELWGLTADGLAVPMVLAEDGTVLEDATGHPYFLRLVSPEEMSGEHGKRDSDR